MISFKNDYSEGAHPQVLETLLRTNLEQTDGYGEDPYTLEAYELIKEKIQCKDCNIRFIVGGTQTNLLVISQILRPYQSVISAETGHINSHETGAIEATGHKVELISAPEGKLTPQLVEKVLSLHTDAHNVEPKMVYISNPTEIGTLYKKAELEALYKYCKEHGLYLFMDGARLASALASEYNDIKLSDYPKLTDVFYIGGTKCGALFGEVAVFINKEIFEGFQYAIKQRGALLAKGRLLGLQFGELFRDNLYFEIGEHSNKMANLLKKCFSDNGFSFATDSYSNQQFPILPNKIVEEFGKKYKYTFIEKYDEDNSVIRFVTSWATKEENVLEFIKDFTEIAKKYK
ncbi:low specificity L-threonine aldolase [Fusobacterium sp.]|uniref:threonine aldolase family protein n=1 Tax=Fusobacterium sp. TaxID=68766 RepID=UPI00262A8080|nr:low specificity L-threonine aldolase [Fusobacterium sp.]